MKKSRITLGIQGTKSGETTTLEKKQLIGIKPILNFEKKYEFTDKQRKEIPKNNTSLFSCAHQYTNAKKEYCLCIPLIKMIIHN